MKHPYENEAHDKMDQKIDELKSYVEQQFCSRGRKLEEICGNLFEKFWRQN